MIGTVDIRVRYAETDQMGVVYHAEYLVWCEIGRTEFFRTLGFAYAELERRGFMLAVTDASVRYHAPAQYDLMVRVETRLTRVGSRGVTFDYAILRATDQARLVSARTSLVAIDRAGRPTPMPPDVRVALAAACT